MTIKQLPFKELGRPGEAIQLLHKMAQAQPRDAAVYRELGFLYLNDEKNPYMARQMFSQSLSLNPEQPDLARVLTNLDTGAARQDKTPASLLGMPKLPELPGMDAQSNMLDDIPLPNAPTGGASTPNPMAPGGSIPGMPVLPGIPGQ